MKKITPIFSLSIVAFCISCGNSNSNARIKSTASEPDQHSITGIDGEWARVGAGMDNNDNGTLDDEEIKKDDPLPGGFDYFHFYANGKCVFDKDLKFDGVYVVKMDKNRKAIFIYGSNIPAGLSEKEKDKSAYIFRIKLVEDKKLVLAPAHLMGKLVLYKRL